MELGLLFNFDCKSVDSLRAPGSYRFPSHGHFSI